MHLLMSLFSGIGYGDAGLQHLCKEANTFAPNTAHAMVNEKVFDRAFHGKKLLQEIIIEKVFIQFYWCCTDNDVEIHDDVAE